MRTTPVTAAVSTPVVNRPSLLAEALRLALPLLRPTAAGGGEHTFPATALCSSLFGPVMLALALMLAALSTTVAAPTPGPWTPLFKGIDHAVGTNTPGLPNSFPRLQVANCVRVNLKDPDVQLFSTPRAPGYVAGSRETLTRTVPNFLKLNQLQVACDAGFYSANPGGSDPAGEGVSCIVYGLQVSTGTLVSPVASEGKARYASMLFTTNKEPFFAFDDRPPGTNLAGIYTAVTGWYPVVSNGVNFAEQSIISYPDGNIHNVQPRTIFGISQDNHFLYLMTIDGRQPGYSDGAIDDESAQWIMAFGAWNAINMDGGGSTSLYAADSTGNPVNLDHSSYLAAYGHERYIGSHFGVFAKPLVGFINDVVALPDDTTATVTWTTISPATSQVRYGLTPSVDLESALGLAMATNHSVLLTNLTPGTGYYFTAVSQREGNVYTSPTFFFTTTNYVTTNTLFDLNQVWKYMIANLDGVNWTAPGYVDSGWTGAGPGVLWADTRGVASVDIPSPTTKLPVPAGSGAYPTYYFRTHFNFTNDLPGVALLFEAYADDGAVFYLNGQELYRLRMPAAPTPIVNATLAPSYPCAGNATCADDFSISGQLIATNLVKGDNVLSVEVHNYRANSPDITFGLALRATVPIKHGSSSASLNVGNANGTITVSWTGTGFILQQAGAPEGPWVDVPGSIVDSPYITSNTGTKRFFRLRK